MTFQVDIERPQPTEPLEQDERLDKYKLDITCDAGNLYDQVEIADRDMRFINVPGAQWEGDFEDKFKKRAKLQFDLTSHVVRRAQGEWSKNRVGVAYKPNDDKTSEEEAKLLNSIFRADYRDGKGKLAINQAVSEVLTCGYGCFKLATRFVDEEDPTNEDQRPVWRSIHNAYKTVYWDMAAKEPDKSDARWCTVLEPYTRDSFKAQWPDEEPISAYEPNTNDNLDRTRRSSNNIYVAVRYEIIYKKEVTFVYANLATGELEFYSQDDHKQIEDEIRRAGNREPIRKKETFKRKVMKSVFNGEKFLQEPKQIAGKHIPIIPVYGYCANIDNIDYYYGLVRKLVDPQIAENVQISKVVENSAASGREVLFFTPDQVAGHEKNLSDPSKPYQLINKTTDEDGREVAAGPVGKQPPPQLDQATATLLQIVPQYIQSVTGGTPQDTLNPNASGKAINALIKRENLQTQLLFENIASAIEWSGEVYQAIAADVYNSRRVVQTLGADGTENKVRLFKEVQDRQTGRIITTNTFRGKKFKSYSDIGVHHETNREERIETFKEIIGVLKDTGDMGAVYGPIFLSILLKDVIQDSGVEAEGALKIIRRNMLAQGIAEPETDEEKQLVAQLNQPKDDKQAELIEGLTRQAQAEANKFESEAREKDSRSIVNIADARKKAAETRKLLSDINVNETKSVFDMVGNILKPNEQRAKSLPF